MADLQAMFPVYLPKLLKEDEKKEDYETNVTQNENNINQNFEILFKAIEELRGKE